MGKEVGMVGSKGAEAIIPLKGRDGVSPCCLPISSAFLSPCHLEAFPFPSKPDIFVADASKESIEPILVKGVRHDGIVFLQTFHVSGQSISLVFRIRMLDDFVCSIRHWFETLVSPLRGGKTPYFAGREIEVRYK